ncbi:Histidine phosphatase family protein [Acanthopleuribacter pedis]
MEACQIYLVRHGETAWNAEGRIQGQTDIELNQVGRDQAEALALKLANTTYDAIFASDLSRARDTAAPVARQKGQAVIEAPRLRELDFGDYEGRLAVELKQQFPDWFKRFASTTPEFSVPNGETYAAFFQRVTQALGNMARERQGQRLLVVVHGGVVSCALRRALPPEEKTRRLAIKNGSITRIDIDAADTWTVVSSDALR